MQYKLHCKASDAAVGVPAIARSHCKSLTEAWRCPEGNNKPRCGKPAGPCKGGAPNHSVDACDIAEWLRLAVEATVAPRSSSPFRENWLLGTVARDGRSSQLGKPASATRAAAEHNNQTTCFAATRLFHPPRQQPDSNRHQWHAQPLPHRQAEGEKTEEAVRFAEEFGGEAQCTVAEREHAGDATVRA